MSGAWWRDFFDRIESRQESPSLRKLVSEGPWLLPKLPKQAPMTARDPVVLPSEIEHLLDKDFREPRVSEYIIHIFVCKLIEPSLRDSMSVSILSDSNPNFCAK